MGLLGFIFGLDDKSSDRDDYDLGHEDGYFLSGSRKDKKKSKSYQDGYIDGMLDAEEDDEEDGIW